MEASGSRGGDLASEGEEVIEMDERQIHENRWKAWRALAVAAKNLGTSYDGSLRQSHWIEWARQLESECREWESRELRYLAGDPNPLDLPITR